MKDAAHRQWLILRIEAPLVSFGAVAIDSYGVIWDFPALSMMTGLFANALGYERTEGAAHQALQDRLVVASRRDDEPYEGVLLDVQNVQMQKSDKGWTMRGAPEGRAGGSYDGPHRRFRDYHPDALVAVVVSLRPPSGTAAAGVRLSPSLDDLSRAIDRPERPLFVGRKSCLPSAPLNAGTIFAGSAHAALAKLPPLVDRSQTRNRYARPNSNSEPRTLRAQWPADEGPCEGPYVDRLLALPDRRNWISGLHGGTRRIVEGRVAVAVRPDEAYP